MPRRKPRTTGSNQHSKGAKRPRGWHRRSKKKTHQIWAEIKNQQQRKLHLSTKPPETTDEPVGPDEV